MKINKLIFGLIAASSLSAAAVNTAHTAKAASWHNGTPKILRGKYKSLPSGNPRSYVRMYIRQHSAPMYGFMKGTDGSYWSGSMQGIAYGAKYKKISTHIYKISGKDKTGTVKESMYIYRKGNKIKFTYFHSYKGQPWMYKY